MILIIFLLSRTTTISAISPFAGHYRFKTNSKGWFDLWPDTFNYITSISIIRPKLFFVATLTKSHIITEIIGMIYRVLHIEDHFNFSKFEILPARFAPSTLISTHFSWSWWQNWNSFYAWRDTSSTTTSCFRLHFNLFHGNEFRKSRFMTMGSLF